MNDINSINSGVNIIIFELIIIILLLVGVIIAISDIEIKK